MAATSIVSLATDLGVTAAVVSDIAFAMVHDDDWGLDAVIVRREVFRFARVTYVNSEGLVCGDHDLREQAVVAIRGAIERHYGSSGRRARFAADFEVRTARRAEYRPES